MWLLSSATPKITFLYLAYGLLEEEYSSPPYSGIKLVVSSKFESALFRP